MATAYRVFGYFGVFSIFGAVLYGFRYDPAASWGNYLSDIVLYAAWVTPHLIMTRGWFKRAVYGSPAGSPTERRIYISIAVTTWLALLWLHRPLPGPGVALASPVQFAATVGFVFCVVAFFEGMSFGMLDGMLAVPGSPMSFSHGSETPLMTEGQYAQVRHPMYRAVLAAGLCSILIHTNLAQALWCALIGSTFVAFIPVEEGQLIAARGAAYPSYMQQTPWRLMRGLW